MSAEDKKLGDWAQHLLELGIEVDYPASHREGVRQYVVVRAHGGSASVGAKTRLGSMAIGLGCLVICGVVSGPAAEAAQEIGRDASADAEVEQSLRLLDLEKLAGSEHSAREALADYVTAAGSGRLAGSEDLLGSLRRMSEHLAGLLESLRGRL